MIELVLHMNNYSITGAITTYQTYPQCLKLSVQEKKKKDQYNFENWEKWIYKVIWI